MVSWLCNEKLAAAVCCLAVDAYWAPRVAKIVSSRRKYERIHSK